MPEPSSRKLSDIRHQKPSDQILVLNRAMLMGFLAVCLALIYWGAFRAEELRQRNDNPRLVEEELRIQRGQIFDRKGRLLAETVGAQDRPTRRYPYPNSGPAVGYYSFRHGTSGVEESYDWLLRGETLDFWGEAVRTSLHQPPQGHDLQITLDAEVQNAAETLLKSHTGAIVLLSVADTDVIAMSSHPGYDPNQLDAEFEQLAAAVDAPLLNRAVQGFYQPGMILQPFILAGALDQGLVRMTDSVAGAGRPVSVNDNTVTCAGAVNEPASWKEVLAHRCPAPMSDLGDLFGHQSLEALFDAFGFGEAPAIPLESEMQDGDPLSQPSLAAVGQDTLTISPLQAGLAWLALTQGGALPTPHLIVAVQDLESNWQPVARMPLPTVRAVSQSSAGRVLSALGTAHGIVEFSSLALSGPEGNQNIWYLGLAPADEPVYAVVVMVESESDLSVAEEIGRQLLTTALESEP